MPTGNEYNTAGRMQGFYSADRVKPDDFLKRVAPLIEEQPEQEITPFSYEFDDSDLDTEADLYQDYINGVNALRELHLEGIKNGVDFEKPNPGDPYAVEGALQYQKMKTDLFDMANRLKISRDNRVSQQELATTEGFTGPLSIDGSQRRGTVGTRDMNVADLRQIQDAITDFNEQDMNAYDPAQKTALDNQKSKIVDAINIAARRNPGFEETFRALALSLNNPYLDTDAINDDELARRKQDETERSNKEREKDADANRSVSWYNAKTSRMNADLRRKEFEGAESTPEGTLLFDQLTEIRNGNRGNDYIGVLFNNRAFEGDENKRLKSITYNPETGLYEATISNINPEYNVETSDEVKNLTEYEMVKAFGTEKEETGYIGRAKETNALYEDNSGGYRFDYSNVDQFNLDSDNRGDGVPNLNTNDVESVVESLNESLNE